MAEREPLLKLLPGFDAVEAGLPLVTLLTGFTDAGSTVQQLGEHIFSQLRWHKVAEFDADGILDYRARRPTIFFSKDHLESFETASLALYLVEDEAGTQFLVLQGFEPDFRWQAASEELSRLFLELEIQSYTWVHAIPFPISHNRDIGITVSGNRADMIDAYSEWRPETNVPGNFGHLLEMKSIELGIPTAGFVLLVPHYLADSEYPTAGIAGFELVSVATSLIFPTDPLREESRRFLAELNKQVSENADLARMIAAIEQSIGGDKAGTNRFAMQSPSSRMPSAEEIAAELEGYLANRQRNRADEERGKDSN